MKVVVHDLLISWGAASNPASQHRPLTLPRRPLTRTLPRFLFKPLKTLPRFQQSWETANHRQQEKLLELIRRLAEDDKEGVISDKVRFYRSTVIGYQRSGGYNINL